MKEIQHHEDYKGKRNKEEHGTLNGEKGTGEVPKYFENRDGKGTQFCEERKVRERRENSEELQHAKIGSKQWSRSREGLLLKETFRQGNPTSEETPQGQKRRGK